MPHADQLSLERAWRLRFRFRARGEFTLTEYRLALGAELAGLPASLVDYIAEAIDRESLRLPDPRPEVELDGEYRLRGGRRVAKRMALQEHREENIALDSEQ
jgi:hypothetical protein